MTFKEIWKSEDIILIHCKNGEEERKLFAKLNKLNCEWANGSPYNYEVFCKEKEMFMYFTEELYFCNDGTAGPLVEYEDYKGYKIIEFSNLDDFKRILTNGEFIYLRGVIEPFMDKIEYIEKWLHPNSKERIIIDINDDEPIYLPCFEPNTMYKGMETNRLYTLEELGFVRKEIGKLVCSKDITCKDCPLKCIDCKHGRHSTPLPLFQQLDIALAECPQLEPLRDYFMEELRKDVE